MKKNIYILALAVALTAALSPANGQRSDPPNKQSLSASIKQRYLERRAKFVGSVKDVYFAVGCKIIGSKAGARSIASKERDLAIAREQAVLDLKEDEDLVEAARQAGLERAARPGECDYYRRHPEAAEAMRRAVGEAAR
jgi:hypothetical protein